MIGDPKTNPPGTSSSEASGATALERRRKNRKAWAKNRANTRRRMAVHRARKKAQRSARLLKLRLGDAERAEVEERSASKRHEILCDLFRSHGVNFDARIGFTKGLVESFVSKLEMHQVELLVAEYEIAIITGVGAGEGDRGKLLKKCATADPTSAQVLVGSSYQELVKDEIKNYLTSQISGDEDLDFTSPPDSAGTQLLDPRLSGDQMNDFLSYFGGNLAEESTATDSIFQAMPNKDEIDRFFANCQTAKGEDFPAISTANEEEGTGPARVFADALEQKIASLEAELETRMFGRTDSSSSNSRAFDNGNIRAMPNKDEIDFFFANFQAAKPVNEGEGTGPARAFALQQRIAPLEVDMETVFGGEDPCPARPSKTTGIYGEGIAPAGGDGGDVLSGRSVDGDDAGIYDEWIAPAGSYSGNVISGSSVVSDSTGISCEGDASAGGGGGEVLSGSSVDSDSDDFDMESLGECVDSDLLQW